MEAKVTIHNHTLTNAQVMALRVAISKWSMELSMSPKPLNPLDKAYQDRLAEIERMLIK